MISLLNLPGLVYGQNKYICGGQTGIWHSAKKTVEQILNYFQCVIISQQPENQVSRFTF